MARVRPLPIVRCIPSCATVGFIDRDRGLIGGIVP
jgi:hypothetical protein